MNHNAHGQARWPQQAAITDDAAGIDDDTPAPRAFWVRLLPMQPTSALERNVRSLDEPPSVPATPPAIVQSAST